MKDVSRVLMVKNINHCNTSPNSCARQVFISVDYLIKGTKVTSRCCDAAGGTIK